MKGPQPERVNDIRGGLPGLGLAAAGSLARPVSRRIGPGEPAGGDNALGRGLRSGTVGDVEDAEYRKLAAVEDRMWYFQGLHRRVETQLEAALGPGSGTVLDCGCGTGGLIRRLAPRHPEWRWTGLDLSPLACELARERSGVDVRLGSVCELPFRNASFDAVVLADVLYHIDDDAAALRECRRVLKPGGCVVVNVPAHAWLWSYHDVAVGGRRRYTRSGVREKLIHAGFCRTYATHWNTLLLPLILARRKLLPPPKGGSDVQSYSPALEAVGRAALASEGFFLRLGGRFSVGSSILATGRADPGPGDAGAGVETGR